MLYSSLGSGGLKKYFAALELVRHLTARPLHPAEEQPPCPPKPPAPSSP